MGVVRLFLALVVAADHWRVHTLAPWSIPIDDHFKLGFNAGYAVMFFYVISGFLITYTLTRNYDRSLSGTLEFYKNRFIRIFSLYWPLVLVAFLVVDLSWRSFLPASPLDKAISLFLFGMDWRLVIANAFAVPANIAIHGLGQAWTLAAELTFYLMAPMLLRSWKIGALLMVASLATRLAFVLVLGTDLNAIWTYTFFPSTFCFFLFGHLVCLASQRWHILKMPVFGAALLACSIAAMTFGGSYQGFDSPRFWSSILCFTIALPAVFEVTRKTHWMNATGDLSYPVYLVHMIVLLTVGPWLVNVSLPLDLMPKAEAGWVSIVVFLGIVTAVAAVIHKLVEVPVARAMHRIADSLPRAKATKAEAD
jgi:peptidoglycan/LPS O-acetylase OafA/YrhL